MIVVAIAVKGHEYLYSAKTAHKVNAKKAGKIAELLNAAAFKIDAGHIWHTFEIDDYDAGDKQPLKDLHICTQEAVCRIGGWEMPYRSYLRRFWVKTKYYGIQQYFALNKTDIRKALKSDALEIVEVSATGHAAYVG